MGFLSLSMESDASYFRRRAEEEYLAANDAGPSSAFRAHRELAARYIDFAEAIECCERELDQDLDQTATHEADADTQPREHATLWL